MKRLSQILLSMSLILFFSSCADKTLKLPSTEELPSFSLPKFTFFDELVVDNKLPRVGGLEIYTDMDEATIEWKPIYSNNIAGYRIFRKIANDKQFQLIKIMDDQYSAHFTDLHLMPNTLYTYAVSTYTKDERVSRLSEPVKRATSPALGELSLFKALSGFPNRIKLLWKPHKSEAVKSYMIQRLDTSLNSWKNIATIEGRLSIEYIDKDVKPGIGYIYQINAKTFQGSHSKPRKTQKAYAKNLPPIVTGLMATTNLPQRIEVIWHKSKQADILYYNVYKSSFPNSMFKKVGQTKANHFVDLLDEDKKVVYYKITAVDKYELESLKQKDSTKGTTLQNSKPLEIDQKLIDKINISIDKL